MRDIWLLLALAIHLTLAAPAAAITLEQIDDFEDGTTMGWAHGAPSPVPPVNVSDAGPAGAGDDALLIQSLGGLGPGSRLVAFNFSQWSGDYAGAGVTSILLDVNNVGATDLTLRLAFSGPGGAFSSTAGIFVPAGGGWQTIAFGVTAADLSAVDGALDVGATLESVGDLRLLSAQTPDYAGEVIAAQILVDNLQAVPEPATTTLLPLGLACLLLLRRR